MSLKLALLKHVKNRGTKIVAQCPACAETGGDSKWVHLVVYPDGRFGCTANPKDKPHRRRIAELVGDPNRQVKPWTLRLHGTRVLSGGQAPQPATATPIISLARGYFKSVKPSVNTPSETSELGFSDNTDTPKPLTRIGESHSSTTSTNTPNASTIGLATPSETSETIVGKARAMFDGKVVAVIPARGEVPGSWLDVLATWAATRDHPGLGDYRPLRLNGWTRTGRPIYEIL